MTFKTGKNVMIVSLSYLFLFSSKTIVGYWFFLSTFNVNPVAAHLMG